MVRIFALVHYRDSVYDYERFSLDLQGLTRLAIKMAEKLPNSESVMVQQIDVYSDSYRIAPLLELPA